MCILLLLLLLCLIICLVSVQIWFLGQRVKRLSNAQSNYFINNFEEFTVVCTLAQSVFVYQEIEHRHIFALLFSTRQSHIVNQQLCIGDWQKRETSYPHILQYTPTVSTEMCIFLVLKAIISFRDSSSLAVSRIMYNLCECMYTTSQHFSVEMKILPWLSIMKPFGNFHIGKITISPRGLIDVFL